MTYLKSNNDLETIQVTEKECNMILEEFEPSSMRKKQKLLSSEGFTRFFMFSDLHDIIDHSKVEKHYQVRMTYSSCFIKMCQLSNCKKIYLSFKVVFLGQQS